MQDEYNMNINDLSNNDKLDLFIKQVEASIIESEDLLKFLKSLGETNNEMLRKHYEIDEMEKAVKWFKGEEK